MKARQATQAIVARHREVLQVSLYGTLEVQNVTDADLFDTFGVQRPGRGYYFKLIGEL